MSVLKPEEKVLGERLRQIFENQLSLLVERGVPPVVISYLQSKWGELIVRAAKFTSFSDSLIFLPVVPLAFVGLPVSVSFIRRNAKSGATFLNPYKIWDMEITPSMPYYIFGVDSGKKFVGRPFEEDSKSIVRRHRHLLTTAEIIALAIHSDDLSLPDLAALGSRCWNGQAFPGLCQSGSITELIGCYLDDCNNRWSIPSCAQRF